MGENCDKRFSNKFDKYGMYEYFVANSERCSLYCFYGILPYLCSVAMEVCTCNGKDTKHILDALYLFRVRQAYAGARNARRLGGKSIIRVHEYRVVNYE